MGVLHTGWYVIFGMFSGFAAFELVQLMAMSYTMVIDGHNPGWWIYLDDIPYNVRLAAIPLAVTVSYVTIRRSGGFTRWAWIISWISGVSCFLLLAGGYILLSWLVESCACLP